MAESAKFPKAEKLCGKSDIAALMAQGRRGGKACLRYFCRLREPDAVQGDAVSALPDGEISPVPEVRVMVSVPKKFFKRAVKRNLLKRRIREAYRLQKELLRGCRCDILFTYCSPEVRSYEEIRAAVASILNEIGSWKR